MTDAHAGSVGASTLCAADWLCLAAAPTFAIMALLTGLSGNPMEMFCMHTGSPLGGMVPMYLLMSAFHVPPWLTLIARWRKGGKPASRPNPLRR